MTEHTDNASTAPETHRSKSALFMFMLLLFSYVINAMDRQLFSVLATDVRQALDMSLPQVGLASTVFTLGMGVAGIPTGWLLSKMSRRNVSVMGLLVFSVATIMTAYSRGMGDLLLYRFISGLGEAMQLTAILAIGTTYFLNHRAVAASSLNFTFGIGAIIGPNLGALIQSHMGWQMPFIAFGLAGLPVAILIMVCVKSWFSEVSIESQQGQMQAVDDAASDSLLSRTPVMLAIATICAGLVIYGYLGLYPTYLREALGFTIKEAGFAVSFYGLGALLSLLGGWLGDKFDYRKILFASLCAAAISGGMLFTPLQGSLTLHATLSFIFGATVSGMVYANLSAGIIKSVKRAKASQASGLFVASLYIPAAFAGYLLGAMRDIVGWTQAGIFQLTGFALISAVLCIMATKEKKPPQG